MSGGAPGGLAPATLAALLDGLLEEAVALASRVPAARPGPPGAARPLHDLSYRCLRVALAYADGMDVGVLPADWLAGAAPPALADGAAIARYGALARARLQGWFQGAGPDEYARVVDTPEGPRTGHALLAATVERVQRQVRALAAALGEPAGATIGPSAGASP